MRRPRRPRTRPAPARRAPAFTLIELMIVMVIIGLIIAFILTAAQDGIRRSEERATQALIMKLEAGVSDRIDALLAARADANLAHVYLADTVSSAFPFNTVTPPTAGLGLTDLPNNTRAQIIARFDLIKAELPDVFFVQSDTNYPLNFGGLPYPGTSVFPTAAPSAYGNFLLPLGVGVSNDPLALSSTSASLGANPPIPYTKAGTPPANVANPVVVMDSTGIFGASYTVANGLYKNLVAEAIRNGMPAPSPVNRGYNGVDDDSSGLIDNVAENGSTALSFFTALLAKHKHKTARSEMLYALLVEGLGPLGSTFSRDDFNDREVRDTDGDGLPEFVDAWGEPIQFYVNPIAFADDSQRGYGTYGGPFDARQQNPVDPNQSLLDPLWWSGTAIGAFAANDSSYYFAPSKVTPLSGAAYLFQSLFGPLTDPNAYPTLPSPGPVWDRGSVWPARRAYQARFLILSGGPDKTPGVPVFDPDYYDKLSSFVVATGPSFSGASPVAVPTTLDPTKPPTFSAIGMVRVESQAAQATYNRTDPIYYTLYNAVTSTPEQYPGADPISLGIREAGHDDITNHNIQAPGGATQ